MVGGTYCGLPSTRVFRLHYSNFLHFLWNSISQKPYGNKYFSFLFSVKIRCFLFFVSSRLVPVTESSVIIAISSPHRKESLDAVHFAIDALKASVPIWKKVIEGTWTHTCMRASACVGVFHRKYVSDFGIAICFQFSLGIFHEAL